MRPSAFHCRARIGHKVSNASASSQVTGLRLGSAMTVREFEIMPLNCAPGRIRTCAHGSGGVALYGPDQRERAPACAARTHIGHSPPSGGQRARDEAVSPGQGNLGGAEVGLRGYACCSDHVYSMRMARVNITVPDDLLNRARAAGLNVSRLAAAALADELDRQAKLGELDAYLADLDAELGPVPQHELKAAREWADAVLPAGRGGKARQARSA